MKKSLLLISILILTAVSASAQCTPDPQYTSPGIYPDSATGFASGCANVSYTQLITNVVPADTCVVVVQGWPCATVSIDSIKIVSFTGLPAGFTYASYDAQNTTSPPDQGTFEGGTTGCVLISGTTSTAGVYNLVINVDVYAGGASTPQGSQVIDWYKIEILDVPVVSYNGFDFISSIASGNQWQLDGGDIPGATNQTHTPTVNGTYTAVNNCGTSNQYVLNDLSLEENSLVSYKVYPNPAGNSIAVMGIDGASFEGIKVVNLNGTVVEEIHTASASNQTIDISNLENGIYLMQIETSTKTEVIRFVKK